MDKKNFKVVCTTGADKHHLFGFHDLVAFNKSGDKLLSLEVDTINRPPLPQEKADVGFSLWEESRFVKLGETNAFNYPQGARQQWLNDHTFIVNNQVDQSWGSDVYDVELMKKVDTFDCSAHCVTKNAKFAFTLDYSRIHRLGGYGYIGLEDIGCNKATPDNQGLWQLNLDTKEKTLLLSIKDIANHDVNSSALNGFHHYITHLVLNPSNTRIAFLHRFFLSDGGVRTRLMTVDVDGQNLRCLAVGFLSHFDWKSDSIVFIWGRTGGGIDSLRSNPIFSNPLVAPFIRVAKGMIRGVLNKTSNQLSMSFLLVEDNEEAIVSPVGQGILTEDGHPMFSPSNRNIIVTDTYPDDEKFRTLMLYFFEENKIIPLTRHRMIDEQPDTALYDLYTQGCDEKILNLMSPQLYSFTRSGLHCDFHPRWNDNGTVVAFDSIHEGNRKIYAIDVSEVV